MRICFTLILFIPFCLTRPIGHSSQVPLTTRNSSKRLSGSQCYFSEIRKGNAETKERPPKSIVSTSCSGVQKPMESLLSFIPTGFLKNEHPLSILLCRGAGKCDLDFSSATILNEWKNTMICQHHADELLLKWRLNKEFRDMHIYRVGGGFAKSDGCTMPDDVGPKHEKKSRPVGRTYLSIKGADAMLKIDHVLLHPGIPICRPHEIYVNEVIMKLNPPPSKKSKVSTSSSEESDHCEDPLYQEPKKKIDRSQLTKSFYNFASLSGEERICSKKKWNQLKPITQEKKARSARNLFNCMLEIMVPDDTEEFKELVYRRSSVREKWTTGSNKNFKSVMEQVSLQFFAAENRRSKLIVLSLVANSVSYLEVVNQIPSLSRYMYQVAKIFGRRKQAQFKEEETPRERYKPEAVQSFVSFITSPHIMIGLPFGTRKVKMSDGSKIEIPNSIRQQSATEIIEMYSNYCKETDQPDILLTPSTMYKILKVCAATKREATACVDYFIANGMEAFEELHRIIDVWVTEGLFEPKSLKHLKTELFEAAQYLRTDYRLHVKANSRVSDHCGTFALSDPSKKELSASCSAGQHKHSHDYKCDRCEKTKETLDKLMEYAEDFVTDSENALGKGKSANLLERRREELQMIQRSINFILEMKKHLLRSAFTSQDRESIISSLKDNEALVTLDFAQKFLPKFYREKQSQYFGKKGISYHIAHTTAKIGEVYVQHSFVHIYSGSVIQDSSLVILTIAHFAKELKKVGIKKIHLRSDNAGAYHSAASIGSLHWLNETTGMEIGSWTFSESQNGKSASDRDANRVKNKAKMYVDKGNDIPTSNQFFAALKENPLNGVSVYHGSVTAASDSGKSDWPGISNLNHFVLENNGIRGRRYGSIGDGILVAKSALKPIKGTYQFDEEAGFTASKMGSEQTERKAVLSGGSTKFWYHPKCAKKSECVKESDIVTQNIEEDANDIDSNALFACSEPGCSAAFLKFWNLEKHVLRGNHKVAPERVTQRDYAVNLFSRSLEEVNESKTFPIIGEALKELKETDETIDNKEGWALQEKKKRKPFGNDVKAFLIECFNEGLNFGTPLSPYTIEKRMRTATNAKNVKRFSIEEMLSVQQIAGFLFREAQKRRSSLAAPTQQKTKNCGRTRRSHRPSPHRRRRRHENCKEANKDVEEMISEEEHPDSDWIAFIKMEEFFTSADELYKSFLENFSVIFAEEKANP